MHSIKSLINKFQLDNAAKMERLLCFSIFLSLLLLLIIYTIKKSTFFTSIPIDGAFQHINPLRRIAAGEIPGRDFQVFHGLAISYLHYPIYALFGKTLFASEISRYLINGLCAFTAVMVIFGGLRRPVVALGLSAFFIISTKLLGIFWLTDPFGDAYSSLAVRTLVPALCLGYLFYVNRKQKIANNRSFSQIVIPLVVFCSVAMTIATEQGIALFLAASSALILVHPAQPKWYIRARDALLFCVLTPVVYLAIIYVITFGDPGEAIRFYLTDLPADQFWYFGAYPNIFPKDFASLFLVPGTSRPFLNYIIIFIAIALVLFSFATTTDKVEKNECRIWMFGLAYGCATLISNLGMISSHYSEAVTRISCALIILFAWTWIERRLSPKHISRFRVLSLCGMALIVLLSPYGFRGLVPTASSFAREYSGAAMEKRYSGVIPVGVEYRNLFSIASTVIPPKSLLGAQIDVKDSAPKTEENYLIFHNPPSELVDLISEGTKIEINDHSEKVEQVSPSHLLLTYSGKEENFHFRYNDKKLPAHTVSSTPFYSKTSGVWVNGVANLPLGSGGCIMVSEPKLLAGVTKYRAVQFLNEPNERHVTSVYNNIVCLDGDLLEPYAHGFPLRFTIKPAIDFSSKDFFLKEDPDKRKYENIDASWLFHAEFDSLHPGLPDPDEGAYSVKVKDTPFFSTKHRDGVNKAKGVYFETWKPSSCTYEQRPTIWSTYTGFFELESNVVNQGNVDYIIHALGKKRRADYLSDFESAKPTFVHTLRPSYTAYERWIQTATWNFYEEILANYEVVRKTDYSLIWRRKSELPIKSNWVNSPDKLCGSNFAEWVTPPSAWDGELTPAVGSTSMDLKELAVNKYGQDQVFVIEATYKIENHLEKLPVFGKVARYFINPIGTATPLPISLPPYENKVVFPIVVSPGKIPTLQFETMSIFGQAGFSVVGIKYRKVVKNADSYKAALLDH